MWDNLDMSQKAQWIKFFVDRNITNLSDIKSLYNEFTKGGHIYDDGDYLYNAVLPEVTITPRKTRIVNAAGNPYLEQAAQDYVNRAIQLEANIGAQAAYRGLGDAATIARPIVGAAAIPAVASSGVLLPVLGALNYTTPGYWLTKIGHPGLGVLADNGLLAFGTYNSAINALHGFKELDVKKFLGNTALGVLGGVGLKSSLTSAETMDRVATSLANKKVTKRFLEAVAQSNDVNPVPTILEYMGKKPWKTSNVIDFRERDHFLNTLKYIAWGKGNPRMAYFNRLGDSFDRASDPTTGYLRALLYGEEPGSLLLYIGTADNVPVGPNMKDIYARGYKPKDIRVYTTKVPYDNSTGALVKDYEEAADLMYKNSYTSRRLDSSFPFTSGTTNYDAAGHHVITVGDDLLGFNMHLDFTDFNILAYRKKWIDGMFLNVQNPKITDLGLRIMDKATTPIIVRTAWEPLKISEAAEAARNKSILEFFKAHKNIYQNYNLDDIIATGVQKHAYGGLLPKPFSYYPIPAVRYARGGDVSSVFKKKKKTVETNPFIYANSTKSGGNWDNDFAKQFNDSILANKDNISFSPEAVAYVIGSESGYDKFAANKISSAVGPIQLLKGSLINMYGDEAGKVAHLEYVDKVRSDTDIIHDTMNYLRMVEGKINKTVGDLSAGRLKQNLLSPNHPITKVIPASVFNSSIPKLIKSNLTLGKSTYLDYINEFNRGYNEFYNAYLDSLNKN